MKKYHNINWVIEQLEKECKKNGVEYSRKSVNTAVNMIIKGYAKLLIKEFICDYLNNGDLDSLAYARQIMSIMSLRKNRSIMLKLGPPNYEIQEIIVNSILEDMDIKMLYEIVVVDLPELRKCLCTRHYSELEGKVDKRRADYQKRKKTKEYQKEYKRTHRKNNKEQQKEYQQKYYQKNKEKIQERHNQYYQENKKELIKYQKKRYQEHHEEEKAARRQYYYDHREQMSEYSRQYKEEHKEYLKQKDKEWRERNKELLRQKRHEKYLREKEKRAGGDTNGERENL